MKKTFFTPIITLLMFIIGKSASENTNTADSSFTLEYENDPTIPSGPHYRINEIPEFAKNW